MALPSLEYLIVTNAHVLDIQRMAEAKTRNILPTSLFLSSERRYSAETVAKSGPAGIHVLNTGNSHALLEGLRAHASPQKAAMIFFQHYHDFSQEELHTLIGRFLGNEEEEQKTVWFFQFCEAFARQKQETLSETVADSFWDHAGIIYETWYGEESIDDSVLRMILTCSVVLGRDFSEALYVKEEKSATALKDERFQMMTECCRRMKVNVAKKTLRFYGKTADQASEDRHPAQDEKGDLVKRADAAIREGRLEDAFDAYSEAKNVQGLRRVASVARSHPRMRNSAIAQLAEKRIEELLTSP
jgi:hypothetical protein